jgi:hypothetical protein
VAGRCRPSGGPSWFPELSDPAARASKWPLIAPHHDWIKDWLDGDVTVARIAQRLRDDHGVAASESYNVGLQRISPKKSIGRGWRG